jgi:hypothetical protein
VDIGDIDAFRLAMASRTKCVICGGKDWRGFGHQIDGKPARLVLGAAWPDGAPVDDYGFNVLAMACVQCGAVTLMIADLLDLDRKGEGDPDD